MSNNLAKAPRLPAGSAMKATEDCQVHQVDSSRTQRQGTRIRKQTVRYGHETSANNEDDQDLRDDHDATFVPDGPMTTQQKRRVFICNFADASSKEKLCALLRRPAKQPDVSPGFSNGNSKKRKSPSSNALELDEPESDPVTQSTDKPSKKQRRQPAKERAENRATAANVQEFLPEPRGQPEVWADVSHSPRKHRESRADFISGPSELVRIATILSGFSVWRLHLQGVGLWLAAG